MKFKILGLYINFFNEIMSLIKFSRLKNYGLALLTISFVSVCICYYNYYSLEMISKSICLLKCNNFFAHYIKIITKLILALLLIVGAHKQNQQIVLFWIVGSIFMLAFYDAGEVEMKYSDVSKVPVKIVDMMTNQHFCCIFGKDF